MHDLFVWLVLVFVGCCGASLAFMRSIDAQRPSERRCSRRPFDARNGGVMSTGLGTARPGSAFGGTPETYTHSELFRV